MSQSPPRFLSLEPVLTCPDRRCRQILVDIRFDVGYAAMMRCQRKKCRTHWWACRLTEGDVRAQLLTHFEDAPDVVDELMRSFSLPATVPYPMYWQIALSGEQFHQFSTHERRSPLSATITLFKQMTTALRYANRHASAAS